MSVSAPRLMMSAHTTSTGIVRLVHVYEYVCVCLCSSASASVSVSVSVSVPASLSLLSLARSLSLYVYMIHGCIHRSMYRDRLAETVVSAFSEATHQVKSEDGATIQSGEKAHHGGVMPEVISASQIQQELLAITQAQALPEDLANGLEQAEEGGRGECRGEEAEEAEVKETKDLPEVEKSEELKELEKLVSEQKEGRKAFNERLLAEQDALAAVTAR